jgi:hypothetical protein
VSEITDRAREVMADPSSPIPYDVYEVLFDLVRALDYIEQVEGVSFDE